MTLTQRIHNISLNMTWMKALIFTSSFSYLGATVVTLMGFPLQEYSNSSSQAIAYALMSIFLLLSLEFKILRIPLAAVYGVSAMMSLSGILIWINYSGEGSFLGPWMAIWDLALAVALLRHEN